MKYPGIDPRSMLDPHDPEFHARDWEEPVEGTVRFAVVGLGWFGREVAVAAIEDSKYCELGAVVSGSKEKAERVGEVEGAIPLTYDEFAAGEASEEFDAAYVATPNALHLPHVEAAAEHGIDVLCEKPLEASVERAEAIVETAREGEIELMTAYRMQTHPPIRRIRDAIDAGFLGDVVHIDGAFSFDAIERDDPDQWRFDPDLAGGGPLFDVGIYPLNTSRFVLGADPTAVQASVVRDQDLLGGMDMHATFQLEFPGDVTATCRTSYHCAGENHLRIVGTDGRIEVETAFANDAERTITVSRSDATTEGRVRHDEMTEEFDYFANHLLSGREIPPDGEHGLADMRYLEAVYESDETGERIEV